MTIRLMAVAVLALALTAPRAFAEMTHNHGTAYQGHVPVGIELLEPGQGAFASISEVVTSLRKSPRTDWSRIDIDALRAHLVDMDMLVSHANTETQNIKGGVAIRITLDGSAAGAASRMVPAHAPVLAAETGWHSTVTEESGGLLWTVSSKKNAQQIRALGFFGLMAVGDHHRDHHLKMATGVAAH